MKRLLWFRRDLRVRDNPLLSYDGEVLAIFIFDTNILSKLRADDKRLSYIFHYIVKLKDELQTIGLDLKVFYGDPVSIIQKLQTMHGFDEVVAGGDYDAYAKDRDKRVSHMLPFRYLQDTYIFKHNEVLKDDGTPYYVFTPFYKKALKVLERKSLEKVTLGECTLLNEEYEHIYKEQESGFITLEFSLKSLGFLQQKVKVTSPKEKIQKFIKELHHYKEKRDFLNSDATSGLSVDLRFGTLGVRELLRTISPLQDSEAFVRQLIFRDYYAYLLFHIPSLETENYKYSFNGIEDEQKYKAFCEAKTGVPIVDAGVRELLQTGNMHNRVRMVAASFFTKDLLLPWQWGEKFFAQYLLDYDKASNVLSWQWSAGTGVDPQPYFRVFNPYLQGAKFDKEAKYIQKYCPELLDIDAKKLHNEEYLYQNSINGYPKPFVHHKLAAKKAIEIFKDRPSKP